MEAATEDALGPMTGAMTYKERFLDNLKSGGMFVRDYDGYTVERLPEIARLLHMELCKLDGENIKSWADVTLVEFVNHWAKPAEMRVLGAGVKQ